MIIGTIMAVFMLVVARHYTGIELDRLLLSVSEIMPHVFFMSCL